ncbi:MAG: alpha/beta fold hydrolase [Actinobacteria bacterium]|nr:alpha/beta fold hydrolase [Actinomycetota bacterium]
MSPTLKRDEVELYWSAEGDGDPVIAIPGLSYTIATWDALVEALVGAGHRVYRFDLRGHGRSSVPAQPYSFSDVLADLEALVGEWKLERPVLCGLSVGSFLSLAYAIEHPGDVRALVLASGSPAARPEDATLAAQLLAGAEESGAIEGWWEALTPVLYSEAHRSRGGEPLARARREFVAQSPLGIAQMLEAVANREDLSGRLAEVAAPTLVLGAEEDALFPPPIQRQLADGIPEATLTLLECGHVSNEELPDEFNAAVLGFLASLPPAG